MSSKEIVALTAMALAEAIHDRRLSCVEVMDAYLDQIGALNPRLNAIVSLRNRTALLAEAAQKDEDLAQRGEAGWMHGFPIAVKDLDAARDLPWTQGSPILAGQIAQTDSIQVARMRAAGAIVIGKTNTPEFGLGSQTFNRVFGATRNPYDLARTAGGSSGGAAVGLATRMLPVADGSDHGGSLRNPAAFNNVFGLRPSYGRVPVVQEDAFAGTLSVSGPMARNPEDLAMLLSIQAGYHPQVPLSRADDPAVFADLARGPIPQLKGKRVAWMGGVAGFPCEPGILPLCVKAMKTFESLGCIVEEAMPDFPLERVWSAWLVLRAWTVSRSLKVFYDRPEWRAEMKPEALWEVENGLTLTTAALAEAQAARTAWYEAIRAFFGRFDAVALPSAQVFPFAVETPWPRSIGDVAMDTYHRWMSVVIPGTMSGCPVIAMPAGFGATGLPMGFQLICPMHREIDCLSFARAYDAAARWSTIVPSLVKTA